MKDELAVLKEAIIAEMKAAEFYKLAAEKSDDPEVKDAFKELAAEEALHMTWLKDIYKNLLDPEKKAEEFAFETFLKTNGKKDSNVLKFSERALATATISVAVYGIAVNMEKNAVEFYRNAADRTLEPRLQKLFTMLAEWEAEHAEQFRTVYETMMDDWWDDQGFAPY